MFCKSRGQQLVNMVLSENNKENDNGSVSGLNKSNEMNEQDNNFVDNIVEDNIEFLSEYHEDQNDVDINMKALFGSDYSDEDPNFIPPGSLCSSDSSESLIQLSELLGHNSQCETLNKSQSAVLSTIHDSSQNNNIENWVQVLLYNLSDTVVTLAVKRNRWRKCNPNNWQSTLAKKRRAEGLPYVTKNKYRPAKLPKVIDCSQCIYKCTEHFSNEERNEICRQYWNLDFKAKKNYILHNLTINAPKRVNTFRKRNTRSYSKKCFFIKYGNKVQVCQNFFCKTLCVSKDVIQDAIQNRDAIGGFYSKDDKRGKRYPKNKTSPEILQAIRSHIESFPVTESHYARKQVKKLYLDRSLNITKMYNLFKEFCREKGITPASEITYRRIFANEYNLAFFKPKKDQCLICTRFQKANTDEKKKLEAEYNEHQMRKIECNLEKDKDKVKANTESTFMSLTFDLQSVLQIPSSGEGLLYYSRKINVFNLTIYEARIPNTAYCFPWTEINGKKGSCEVASILYYYLSNCLSPQITHVSLFSDTYGGQNRNQYVAAMLLWSAQVIPNIHVIEQKFLEPGHTYMEVDSMHSSIESAKKYSPVYSMIDWINIFRRARKEVLKKDNQTKKVTKIEPYRIKEFKFDNFFDAKSLAEQLIKNRTKDNQDNTVKWLKIKHLKYVKGERNKIYFNYSMNGEMKHINLTDMSQNNNHSYKTRSSKAKSQQLLSANNINNSSTNFPTTLKKLYSSPLPISEKKKKDLENLCKKGIIPEELHPWYKGLITAADVIDTVPDTDIDESDDGE